MSTKVYWHEMLTFNARSFTITENESHDNVPRAFSIWRDKMSLAIISVQETFPKNLAQESSSWVEKSQITTVKILLSSEGRLKADEGLTIRTSAFVTLWLVIWQLLNRLMYQIFVNHNVENRKGKKHKSSQRSEGLSYELTETV